MISIQIQEPSLESTEAKLQGEKLDIMMIQEITFIREY